MPRVLHDSASLRVEDYVCCVMSIKQGYGDKRSIGASPSTFAKQLLCSINCQSLGYSFLPCVLLHCLNLEQSRASMGLQVTLVTCGCLKECTDNGCLSI